MPPSERDILAARLARMRTLIAELESACAANASNHEKFATLKAELNGV